MLEFRNHITELSIIRLCVYACFLIGFLQLVKAELQITALLSVRHSCLEYEKLDEGSFYFKLKKINFSLEDLTSTRDILIIYSGSIEKLLQGNELLKQRLKLARDDLSKERQENERLKADIESLKRTRKTKVERIADALAS